MNTNNEGQWPRQHHPSPNGTRDLHVKAIPESVWIRARCNATQSGLSFKEYVIRILGASLPIANAKK